MLKKFLFSFISITLVAAALVASPHVVFDFGGVMTQGQDKEAVVQFLQKTLQLSDQEFQKANLEKKEALKAGIHHEEFWLAFAKRKGAQLPESWVQDFKNIVKKSLRVNPEMYAMVAELKKKQIPVAMLSNIDGGLAKLIREFGLYEPFNPCLLSCEMGCDKPDPKIFHALLRELNVPACEIIFIDDLQENVDAAQKLGIDAITFKSTTQMRAELVRRCLL